MAEWLEAHEDVAWVNYPGLKSSKYNALAKKYLPEGQSGLLAFGLKGGFDAGKTVADETKLFALVANFGDSKSLVIHPASTTHQQLTPEEQESTGVSPDLIRLSVGLENVDDLKQTSNKRLIRFNNMSQLANIAFEQYDSIGRANGLAVILQAIWSSFGESPVVLVNHSLTGDADVAGENGWWSELIGDGKVIDTHQYTILAFNFPGNGVDNNLIDNYEHLVLRDIAYLFKAALDELGIDKLYAAIGGSIGGALVWEMGASFPELIENLIPVACDWKTSSWVLANTLLQDRILRNSKNPLQDARIHAMMCYRTPESFKERFGRSIHEEKEIFNIDSWLLYHGEKLNNRFHYNHINL